MKKMLILGLAAVVLACASAVFAYPTLGGPTGLVSLPNAEVVRNGILDVAVDYYNTGNNDRTFTDRAGNVFTFGSKNSWPIRAIYGFNDTFEIGAAYVPDAFLGKGFWDINAKWRIPVNYGGWDFGLGALYGQTGNATSETAFNSAGVLIDPVEEKFKATEIYLAGTGCLPLGEGVPKIFATLGVNWTQVELFDTNDGFRFFLGLDAVVAQNLEVLAEYQTKVSDLDEVDGLWGAAVRYAFTPAWSAQLGVSNGPIIGTGKTHVFVGINYGFNLGTTE